MRAKSYVPLWQDILKRLAKEISMLQNNSITEEDIYRAVTIKYSFLPEFVVPTSIFFIEPDFDVLLAEFRNYNFDYNKIELAIEFAGVAADLLEKAQVKNNGSLWVIHAYDKDPFPSNPHAHNIEANLKLDLRNGNLYKKTQYVGSISKRELADVRSKFEEKGINLP